MILNDLPVRVHCKKGRNNNFHLSYFCPETSREMRVPQRASGPFSSKELALQWAVANLPAHLKGRKQFGARQGWRLNRNLVRMFNEYQKLRIIERERSCQSEFSLLSNFVFPFFVIEMKQNNPNRWCEFGDEFSVWLQEKAITKEGGPLGAGSAKRIISIANQFLLWLRRKKYLEYRNYRKLESLDSRRLPKKNFLELISEDNFFAVYEKLKVRKPIYAEMWYLQRRTGMRANEIPGLALPWLSDQCTQFIRDEFESKGMKVFGSLYLESQLKKKYVCRNEDGSLDRVPLKGRRSIGPESARTIPIVDKEVWEILLNRYEVQCELWNQKKFGSQKLSYLLFDGARYNSYLKCIQETQVELDLPITGTHALRHAASTDWAMLKISEKISELVLGHKSQIHQHYIHIVALVNAERANYAPMPALRKNVEN